MTCEKLLNAIGLVIGMAGVFILFIFSPAQPKLEEPGGMGMEDGNLMEDGRTVGQHRRDVERRRLIHARMSKVGLSLIFLGFAFQLVATLI